MSSVKLEIFNPPMFDNTIIREELQTYYPHTKAFDNSDSCEITINHQDRFIAWHESSLCISGELKDESVPLDPNATCELGSNFAAFLFESLTYELNGKEIDKIRFPGLTSTIKCLTLYNKAESVAFELTGWCFVSSTPVTVDDSTKKKFHVRIPLHYLFGVFQDYRRVIFGKHTFRLVRARTDDNCCIITGNAKPKITINSIELKAKHIFPNDVLKLRLLNDLNKDRPILIGFRSWEIYELPALNTTSKEIWNVKTSMSLERPQYIIVAFQTNRRDNPKNSKVHFDHLNLISIKAYLNSTAYPLEGIKTDFKSNDYTAAYDCYKDFQTSFLDKYCSEPLMDYKEFKNRPLFILDCSKQEETLQQSTIDLKLEFESNENFPPNTKAFCLIIHDALYEQKPLSGVVRAIM